ncbi:MAG: hypothetical protein LBE51_07455 [Acidovorax sp.]|jgi:hypothetical protein|nr:hypothetical protein [Acidovorax sp.]MDR3002856.1 hypothetical protein [Acidovorax sp.]
MSDAHLQDRQRCEQVWQQATQARDRQALRNLRLYIIDATRRARREPGAREQWQAWMLLRCVLLLPKKRF